MATAAEQESNNKESTAELAAPPSFLRASHSYGSGSDSVKRSVIDDDETERQLTDNSKRMSINSEPPPRSSAIYTQHDKSRASLVDSKCHLYGYNDDDDFPEDRHGVPPRRPLIDEDEVKEISTYNDGVDAGKMLRVVEAAMVPPVPPPIPRAQLGRTESTQVRLRHQGFQTLRKEKSQMFAVQSIRRGTDDWFRRIEPFVADLVFRSLVKSRYYSEPTFRPYVCHCAVLFVDLSGYSKITSALAHRGAHAISQVVNEYLDKLLQIIHSAGGDVVKFAGDAVLVVWDGIEKNLKVNVMAAAWCALQLQIREGTHPVVVDGRKTKLEFKIHCGLACGAVESEVFEAPTHMNMQRLYHSIGGKPVDEIGDLVDLAKSGEVCISAECAKYLEEWGEFQDVPGARTKPKILMSLEFNADVSNDLDAHIVNVMKDRLLRRDNKIEEEFIHPTVLSLLSHGGKSPTQIAQMRNLCVLFIAMVANGSSVNWLLEVQRILDRNRCPIVQIIDDDKGVHLVAAINLYEAIPECAVLGVQVCQELREREVGCAIGMAMGSTFCGVTGSSAIACRWDITGPPAVRAARLMQYAIAQGHEVVIDHSIYEDPIASSRLSLLHKGVRIKGTKDPQKVYTISSDDHGMAAFRILEQKQTSSVHEDKICEIQQLLSNGSKRAIIITGPPLSGKKYAAQVAAGREGMTPFLHVSSESAGYLQLAHTIATWFRHVDDNDVRAGAVDVLDHLKAERWSRAHDACIELMNLAVVLDMKACFVVDRVQLLDEFSISLIREGFRGRRTKGGRELEYHWSSLVSNMGGSDSDTEGAEWIGRICFLCVHISLYEWPSAQEVKERITRSESKYDLPIITIGKVPKEELGQMFCEIADMEAHERWLRIYGESSGYCAGYFVERVAASRFIGEQLRLQGETGYAVTNEDLMLQIPTGMIKQNRELAVHDISGDIAMKFTQVFDGLPPLFQQFLKVLTIAAKSSFYVLLRQTVWEVLNDLIAEGVDKTVFEIVVCEMNDMFLIELGADDMGEKTIALSNPALADVAFDVATPDQIDSISMVLLERLQPLQDQDFRIPLVMACLHYRLDEGEALIIHLFKKGYRMLLGMRKHISKSALNWFLEAIDEEIVACGYETREILGEEFRYEAVVDTSIGSDLLRVKYYMAPLSFGPMGQTLTVITRNVFHEAKNFRGCTEDEMDQLRNSFESACGRYCNELFIIESFLEDYGLRVDNEELDDELQLVMYIAEEAQSPEDVSQKALAILNDLVPKHIISRRDRLLEMVAKVRKSGTVPEPVKNAEPAVKLAYDAFFSNESKNNGAHDALMKLAVNQWKPRKVPEYLPSAHSQSLANIRTKVLRRVSDAELLILRHQLEPDDLGAFLVITPLLYQNLHDCYTW